MALGGLAGGRESDGLALVAGGQQLLDRQRVGLAARGVRVEVVRERELPTAERRREAKDGRRHAGWPR